MEFSELKRLIGETRSVRNFDTARPISEGEMLSLVGLCCLVPSSANLQPLKIAFTVSGDGCAKMLPLVRWAGYYTENKPPFQGNEPTGYAVICADRGIAQNASDKDVGICAYAMVLGARSLGLGSCMIGSFDRQGVSALLGLSDALEARLVIALGAQKEEIKLVEIPADGSVKYYRNENGEHCVPKRCLDEILIRDDIVRG